jgi:hypothetical protein
MKARQLLIAGISNPETLHVAFRAFDLAWDEMQREHPVPHFAHEDARTRLAFMMVALVPEHPRDATQLKAATLEALLRTPS